MTVKRRFWWAVALQVAVLVSMIAVHSYTVATGAAVTLKTVPADPWSYLTGRYVALNYEISRLTEGQVPMEGAPYKRGQTVWVTLQKGDPYWTAVAVSTRRPALGGLLVAGRVPGPNQVALRGTVTSAWQPYLQSTATTPWEYNLRYGIEQFYIPEREKTLDRRGLNFTVEVLVDSFGRAVLHRVFLDGQPIRWQ